MKILQFSIRRTARSALLTAALLATPNAAAAQRARVAPADSADTVATATTMRAGGHVYDGSLFTRRDAVTAGALVVATAAVMPFDLRTTHYLRQPALQNSTPLRSTATAFRLLGDPGTVIIGLGLYGVGRLGHAPVLADIGLHSTEALVLSAAIGGLLKGMVGRKRPYASPGDPRDYRFAGGFGGGSRTSFPSGHSTASFTMAAAITEEISERWPRDRWWVATSTYGAATLVAVSRVYNHRHWASDVIAGAALGTFSGLAVVRYMHRHPGNVFDRWLLPSAVAPVTRGTGAEFIWSFPR